MNKRIVLMACVLAGVAMASCNKETDIPMGGIPEGAVMLTTEGYTNQNGEKTSVAGTTVEWVGEGEVVRLNSYTPNVEVSGDKAFVRDVTLSGAVYGYYPSTIVAADGWETTTPTVTVPSSYACVMSGDRQVVALPMVAYSATAGDEIEFKHLTAAVNVMVWNATANTLYIDSVIVITDEYRINGNFVLNLVVDNYGIIADNSSVPESNRKVKVSFASPMEIATGEANAKNIQVPIMPIGADNITIEVYSHNALDGTIPIIQTHTFSYTNNSAALGRNVMLTARVKMDPNSPRVTSKGTFTINADGDKIYFSQGNLQYQASSNTWRFAEHQYECIGYDNERISSSYTGWIDLFGWGTSGHVFKRGYGSAYQPWSTNTTESNYGPQGNYDLTGTFAEGDWGVANSIGSMAAGTWRTLSVNAWDTIFNIRTTTTTNLPNSGGIDNIRFTMATINNTYKGMIVFPDNYTHPDGTGFTSGVYNTYSNYTASVSLEGWALMESAGAVFLPATGYRGWNNNIVTVTQMLQGWYWSNSSYDNSKAYGLVFNSTSVQTNYNEKRKIGMSVRLVRNAN